MTYGALPTVPLMRVLRPIDGTNLAVPRFGGLFYSCASLVDTGRVVAVIIVQRMRKTGRDQIWVGGSTGVRQPGFGNGIES
jgi:hypothetical protein